MENISCFIIILSIISIWVMDNVCVKPSAILMDSSENKRRNFFDTEDIQHPAKEFSHYSLVQPLIYHGREKREITHNNSYHNLNTLTLVLPISNEELIIDLILNKQLIAKGYFRQTQENGTYRKQKLETKDIELCHYTGNVRNKPNSWVALSTCDGLSGVIYDGNHMHYIEKNTRNKYNEHFLYSDKNLVEQNTCGHTEEKKQNFRNKRDSMQRTKSVKKPWNANTESRYVELVLVVDNGIFKGVNENFAVVEKYCINIANIMNRLFFPLNIFIALVGVIVWTEKNEINISTNGENTLANFLKYRRDKLREHPNDNAQLLTKSTFEGGLTGRALRGTICTFEYSGGVNTDHSSVAGITATTVAHVLGHNFGMDHDTVDCECPDQRCIMSPSSSSTAPTQWSSCSQNALKLAYERGIDHCLRNKPVSLYVSTICGNGFLEDGEECDCGLPESCTNSCCNPVTCMLHKNATCATGECCDLKTCKFKRPGNICRRVTNECDLPEYCTGDGEFCPSDIYKMDTENCGTGNSYCYQGSCNSHFDQCRLLWGSSGEQATDACYKLNIKGNKNGNCGYKKLNASYKKCNEEDVFCGMLQCNHNSEALQYGFESASILSRSYINDKGKSLPCKSAIIDVGLNDPDPGMVPNGAKCGDEKVCLNQKCVPIATLREDRVCRQNCYNNGWCNNLGHCHCNPGYVLPFCQFLSPGGSVDSGPPEAAVYFNNVLLL